MPFIPVPDCVQVKIEGSLDGQMTINDLYFRSTIGPRSAADVIALNNAVASWYGTDIALNLNVAWLGRKTTARGLTNANAFQAESSLLGVDGAVTGEAMPNNVTMAVKFATGLSGRSYHGRNYVPGLSDTIVDGNNIDPDWAALIVTGYSNLIFPTAAIPSGWIWVVVSKFANNEPRTEGIFTEVIAVSVTDLTVDSMRTRLPGRGR